MANLDLLDHLVVLVRARHFCECARVAYTPHTLRTRKERERKKRVGQGGSMRGKDVVARGVRLVDEREGASVGAHVHLRSDAWCVTSQFAPDDDWCDVADVILPGRLGRYVYPSDAVFSVNEKAHTSVQDWRDAVRCETEMVRGTSMRSRVNHLSAAAASDMDAAVVEDDEDDEDDVEADEDDEDDGDQALDDVDEAGPARHEGDDAVPKPWLTIEECDD